MKINSYSDEVEWKQARLGKITGSKLSDVVVLRGTCEKKGFYQLIAERLAIPRPAGENAMLRGHTLEKEAVELVENKLGKTFIKDLVIWERDDNSSIAISPDAYSEDLTEAVEVKCLNSADHIKAVINNEYPDEYRFQVYQYFIVNDKLETLYFAMYDPSLCAHQLVIFEIKRKDIEGIVIEYLEYQKLLLSRVNKIVNELSF